ncbi:hypothetical protein FLAN108750_00995 [Flavobacterium antarcticum]|uniref:hypothetical protein n=1 Tax=Flavobacterium antarcticum TaxID=271155 RepID=UPI0003B570B2|nr:hypothetical protein [Flavobacterium antarcticum]
MNIELSKWIITLFGTFIIFIGFLMLIAPVKARNTLKKAGSTNFINYTEITLRLIPAIALIICSETAKFPVTFKTFGWVMLITSLILYAAPRKLHHHFSMKSAEILKPFYFQLLAPFAFLLGGFLIYSII